MQGLRESQNLYDGRLPLADFDDQVRRFEPSEGDIERFIAALAVSLEPEVFLESVANQHFDQADDFDLHVAVARQWVADKAAVGGVIGAVFWKWATACAYEVVA